MPESFSRAQYIEKLQPNLARVIFKARTRMFDIKINFKKKYRLSICCPFCKRKDETFGHLFAFMEQPVYAAPHVYRVHM